MTHASLFSGIGGPELAAMWLGWRNLFHCEINPFCRSVLGYHFPESKSYEDVKKTNFSEWRGRVDVLSAGFPCQPFSLAGKRGGANDDRYLWPEVVRVVREIRPAWIVCENVAGILTMVQPGNAVALGDARTLFGTSDRQELRQRYVAEDVCRDLEAEGYSVQPFVIPACSVGAPHRRDRVFFVANRYDHRCWQRESKQEPVSGSEGAANISACSKNVFTSYCSDARPESERGRENEIHSDTAFANNNDERLQQFSLPESTKRERRSKSFRVFEQPADSSWYAYDADRWEKFPAQPAVCRRNDGLPFNVDDLSISYGKWREESIKAYGNAIVPQVMYEIFKAIERSKKWERKKDFIKRIKMPQ